MKKMIFILLAVLVVVFAFIALYSLRSWLTMKNNISKNNSHITEVKGFGRPFSVIKDEKENLYVCDFGTNTVKVFDKNYTLVKEIGSSGNEGGQFKMPHAVDFDAQRNIFITDYGNKRVQKFSPEGDFISILTTPKQLKGPATSYFDLNYNLYVSDFDSNSLLKFSPDQEFLGWIGAKSDGNATSGWEMSGDSSESAKPGGFNRVHSAKVDTDGTIYVIDTWNHRIQRFSSEGKFTGWIGAKEDGDLTNGWETNGTAVMSKRPGGFNAPIAFDFSGGDEFVVLEYGNPRVQRFSKEGRFIGWFGAIEGAGVTNGWAKDGLSREGSEVGAIKLAYDIRVYKNIMYIADTGNKRVQVVEFY